MLHGFVEKNAIENPQKEAIIFQNERITYQELNEKAEQLALGLIELGVQRGGIVGILMPSRPEYIFTTLGVWKAGAAILPINFHLTNPEIAYVLNKASVSTLIMIDKYSKYNFIERLEDLQNLVPTLKNVVVMGKTNKPNILNFQSIYKTLPSMDLKKEYEERRIKTNVEDMAFLVYTGGTTGIPKGAIITHRARYSVDKSWGDELGVTSEDRILVDLPLFHLYVWHTVSRSFISCATLVLMEEFNLELSLKLIEKEKITFLAQVPTMYIYQINAPNIKQYDLSSLRIGLTGGAIFPEELFDITESTLGGIRIINFYGLTEDGGAVTLNRFDDNLEQGRNTVGKAIPGVELKIVDDDRKEVLLNTSGELAVKSSWIRGYYNMPEETKIAIDSEGWLYTGDLGSLDEDGYFTLRGRKKDMFISGGENIYPIEIEALLQKHPKILMAVVIGVPHDKMGEVGRVYVVLKEGQQMTAEEVREYCKGKLASIKIPREVEFRTTIPLTSVGKINKDALRQELA